jgi:plasmid maintenance system antidote protein VapI
MKKITQRKIAEMAGIKAYFLNHILHARKGCPPSLAPRLEELTGIDRKVWVWGSREKKQAEWNKFVNSSIGLPPADEKMAETPEKQTSSGQRSQTSNP